MRVLIACEFSGIVREAFAKQGHDAWSCDLLPTEIVGNHIQDDVLKHLDEDWDMMIAHPPCTYLANNGVRWLYRDDDRWELMRRAGDFLNLLLNAQVPHIAVENPIPHKWARQQISPYSQLVQPHYFIGSNESKATCLWLKGLHELKRTQWLDKAEIKQSIWRMPPSEIRGKERSRFPVSIAQAMASQWGSLPLPKSG